MGPAEPAQLPSSPGCRDEARKLVGVPVPVFNRRRDRLPNLRLLTASPPMRLAFALSMAVNLVAFGSFLFQPVFTVDDYALLSGGLRFATDWQTTRPLADGLVPTLFGGMLAPTLQLLIIVTAHVAMALVVARTWGVRGVPALVVVTTLMTTTPPYADQYVFLVNVLRLLPLAFPLAMLAYVLAGRPAWWGFAGSVACLGSSFLLYQLALNTYVMLWIADLFLLVALCERGRRLRARLGRLKAAAAAGLVAAAAGVVVVKLVAGGDSRVSSSLALISSWGELSRKVHMFQDVWRYLSRDVFLGARYGTLALAAALLILVVVLVRRLRRRCGVPGALTRMLVLAGLAAALFVASLLTQAFNTYHQLHWRVLDCGGVAYGFLWALVLRLTPRRTAAHRAALWLGGVVVVLFVTVDNYYHFASRVRNSQELAVANRVVDRIETSNTGGRPVVLVTLGTFNRRVARFESRIHSEVEAGVFRAPWSRDRVWPYLGLSVLPATKEHVARACELGKGMSAWPAAASVLVEDGLAVVKLSGDDRRCLP